MNIASRAAASALAFAATACFAQEKIALTFAWPDTLKASVHVDKSKARSAPDMPPQRMSLGSSYEMVATRSGSDMLLRFGAISLDAAQRAEVPEPEIAKLQEVLGMGMPSYRVSAQGHFAGVQDIEKYRDKLRELLMKELPPGGDPQAAQRMQRVVDVRLLNGLAAAEWNYIVGAWAGGALELGKDYGLATEQPMPIGPAQAIKTQLTMTIVRWLPCEREGERRCVEIELTSVPDPGEFAKAISGVLKDISQDKAPASPDVEGGMELRLVTEPDTLVPHAYTVTKQVRIRAQEAGKQQELVEMEETRVQYTYPR
jgi:hypothetical protein